jgi:phage terminase large subunit-like protein
MALALAAGFAARAQARQRNAPPCAKRLMTWCVGNVKIEPTATAIRATMQNAGDAKIDPWCALMDAATVMARNPAPPIDIAAMIV